MRRTFPALLLALVATALFTSPATAGGPAKTTVTATAEQELEAEVAYRCVLYGMYQETLARAQMWRSLRESAVLMSSADEATKDGLFDRFKVELRAGIDSTPYELDFESLEMQLARSRDDFDFVAVAIDVGSIWNKIMGRMAYIASTADDNDRRLDRDNPAVLRVHIPDNCPSAG